MNKFILILLILTFVQNFAYAKENKYDRLEKSLFIMRGILDDNMYLKYRPTKKSISKILSENKKTKNIVDDFLCEKRVYIEELIDYINKICIRNIISLDTEQFSSSQLTKKEAKQLYMCGAALNVLPII